MNEMKRRHSRNESHLASTIAVKEASVQTGDKPSCAPPSKLRRQGSKLASALRSIVSRSQGWFSERHLGDLTMWSSLQGLC